MPTQEFRALERQLGLDLAPWLADLKERIAKTPLRQQIALKPMTAALLLQCRKYPLLAGDYNAIIVMLRESSFYGWEGGL